MGHASEEVGHLYSNLKEDVAFRLQLAERIGLGFDLVHIGPENAAAGQNRESSVNQWRAGFFGVVPGRMDLDDLPVPKKAVENI
jgi:hypothetical protein